MQSHGEPSVEEILDSIKKVIARDSQERSDAQRTRSGPVASDPDSTDVTGAEEVLELGSGLGEEIVFDSDAALDAAFGDEAGEDEEDDEVDALTRGDTREAMRQNFAALTMLSKPGKQPQIVRQGETSLEGLVREMLRPMLAQWLDDNLPGMVEELVKAEIARIAGKKR